VSSLSNGGKEDTKGEVGASVRSHRRQPELFSREIPPASPKLNCQCTTIPILDIDEQPEWSQTLHDPEPEEQDYAESEKPEQPAKPRVAPPPKAANPVPVPPKPKGPAGPAVSNSLDLQTKGKVDRAVRDVTKTIDDIHGDGNLTKIPIKNSYGKRAQGAFWREQFNNRPIRIDISPNSDHVKLNVAHEIGHLLDYNGIPRGAIHGSNRSFMLDPQFSGWFKAVKESEAIKSIEALKGKTHGEYLKPGAEQTTRWTLDRKHINYLLSENEMWARSYAQYIATKSGDSEMATELDKQRASAYGQVYNSQWTDKDFEPIGKEIDKLFQGLGWIK